MPRVPLLSRCALAAVLTLAGEAAAQPADGVERALVEQVRATRHEALELLESTVEINSGTLNFEGVRQVGRIFAAELEELGFVTRWVDGEPFGRAGHLVAERTGDGPRILLIGHLDTVFERDSPFQSYEPLEDGRARGPGVTDMKGGNVVMVHALQALAAAGVLDELEIAVVLTGDEEKAGRPLALSRAALREAAAGAAAALGFEDGDGDPATAVIARRGSSSWRLDVTGTPAHSSQIFQPEVGAGAIYEAARVLHRFRERLADEADLTYNPGVVVGGTEAALDGEEGRGSAFGKNNVVAERAHVTGDLRALSPEQ
ncbi:MAG: M20/M25/M40 family metallo-hydrolase, partial [Thermoanaerobaculia bacterium]|nr:M20/M25/M40 family metallo-hydrolase [Thermoanaerobaculia bacterium]